METKNVKGQHIKDTSLKVQLPLKKLSHLLKTEDLMFGYKYFCLLDDYIYITIPLFRSTVVLCTCTQVHMYA